MDMLNNVLTQGPKHLQDSINDFRFLYYLQF